MSTPNTSIANSSSLNNDLRLKGEIGSAVPETKRLNSDTQATEIHPLILRLQNIPSFVNRDKPSFVGFSFTGKSKKGKPVFKTKTGDETFENTGIRKNNKCPYDLLALKNNNFTWNSAFKAAIDDPTSWTDLHTATEVLNKELQNSKPKLHCIAYALHEDDNWSAIDLDGCVDPETNKFTIPTCAEIVKRCLASGFYAEISPSRTGIRIIGEGKLPSKGGNFGKVTSKNGDVFRIETYGGTNNPGEFKGHFVTLTGNQIKVHPDAVPFETFEAFLIWMHEEFELKKKSSTDLINGPDGNWDGPELQQADNSEYNQNRYIDYLKKSKHDDAAANDRAFAIACEGWSQGLSRDVTTKLMLEHYLPRCKDLTENALRKKVAHAYEGKAGGGAQGVFGGKNDNPSIDFPNEVVDAAIADLWLAERSKPEKGCALTCDEDRACLLLRKVESNSRVSLFLTPSGDTFATFPHEIDGEEFFESHPIASKAFAAFLRKTYRNTTKGLCSKNVVQMVIDNLSANVKDVREAFVRLAHHQDSIYVDLADRKNVVKISPGEWSVMPASECPVRFFRAAGVKPLPIPLQEGNISALPRFMNLNGDDPEANFRRMVLYLASTFVNGPQIVLLVVGQKGSAKTFLGKVCKALIDPNEADAMTPPKDERELFLACRNQYLVFIDNISRISRTRSDAHCRIATGAAHRERLLYANGEEFIYRVRRPQLFTAIKDVIDRNDLSERKLTIQLQAITKDQRQTERKILSDLEKTLPELLGGLFSIVAGALRELPGVQPIELPRMADAAEFLLAVERHLGWEPGTVENIFSTEADADAQSSIENDTFIAAFFAKAKEKVDGCFGKPWIATGKEILGALSQNHSINPLHRPDSANKLAGKLREYASELRLLGLTYEKASGGDHAYTIAYADPKIVRIEEL